MRTRSHAATATTLAVVSLTAVTLAPPAAAAQPGDQARADAAVAAFNEWITQAGYQSDGPQALEEDADDAEDDELAVCLEGFETILASLAGPADGETARAYSDDFSRAATPAGTSAPESSDSLGDIPEAEEYAAAFVVTFDADHADTAERFVTHFGSDQAAECFREQLDETLSVDVADTDGTGATEYVSTVEVENAQDIGVGDHSARMAFSVNTEFMDESFDYAVEFFAAQTGPSLALVLHGRYGEIAPATIDYSSALQSMVDALAG
jgi:hypothetical protein